MSAPYIPLAMCIATGAVPQWYRNAPGTRGDQRNAIESPGITLVYTRLGAICAAWKSMLCGMRP